MKCMSGGTNKTLLTVIEMQLRNKHGDIFPVFIDVYESSLSRKWLGALKELLTNQYHLEKNYCFFGFPDGPRTQELILTKINESIAHINSANLGYNIHCEPFTVDNTTNPVLYEIPGNDPVNVRVINHEKLNKLHRYFEDLQGVSGNMSPYYLKASAETRWHIRQLNLLCHEYESLVLSIRKKLTAPMWMRPSQLMCWLNAPRFTLDDADYELFGVDTIARPLGGVFVGVNKAVGKHHWEVFNDEGKDSRVSELITSTLKSQTEAAGDFDIEWAVDPGEFDWMKQQLSEFKEWLIANNFDPEDKQLTIGHPQVGQVDLIRTFGTDVYSEIWEVLQEYMDVYAMSVDGVHAVFDYKWSDFDFSERQVRILGGN